MREQSKIKRFSEAKEEKMTKEPRLVEEVSRAP